MLAEAEDSGGRPEAQARQGGAAQMPSTLWTLVLMARDLTSPGAQGALARLCELYWFPLYGFVRRQGFDYHQAQDLTQAFFEHLFRRPWLDGVGKEKGRFRTFLLCSLCNFVNNEREKQHTLKRGGAVREFVPFDVEVAESRLAVTPSGEDPRLEFERRWACALVERALASLRNEYGRCGKSGLFDTLAPFMARPIPPGFYQDKAVALQTTEGALRTAMSRLLQRFGDLLRTEVAGTVAAPEDVDDELREVLRAWARQ